MDLNFEPKLTSHTRSTKLQGGPKTGPFAEVYHCVHNFSTGTNLVATAAWGHDGGKTRKRGAHGDAVARAYNGSLGEEPPVGIQAAEPPREGSGSEPLKLKVFEHLGVGCPVAG